ncbi:hypothetical protein RJ640_027776 [Escallonia rubra]|uniref:Uncharacterized protein n=1 Tax=Escallonia rubra TaxID=112253 RepID=A0AA88QVI3_9ASTE|nr:hypothetical protein RJ640_027776 [Escallonia rubra]
MTSTRTGIGSYQSVLTYYLLITFADAEDRQSSYLGFSNFYWTLFKIAEWWRLWQAKAVMSLVSGSGSAETTVWNPASRRCSQYSELNAICLLYGMCYAFEFSGTGEAGGVERLLEALSANMWPGMVLKSGDKIVEPSLPEKQDLSEEESDYEIEYEMLSAGSAEPWDDTDGGWVTANGTTASTETGGLVAQNRDAKDSDGERVIRPVGEELPPSTSTSQLQEEIDTEAIPSAQEADGGTHYEFEDLEQLMSEIGNMRDSLRLMPDFQRREMAANLAMKMAVMFGDSSGDEGGS